MLASLHNSKRFEACLACTIHLIWSMRPLVKAVNLDSSNSLSLHKHSMQFTLSVTFHRCDKESQMYTIHLVDQND